MEWEYWLIKPSARGPEALGPQALLADIPTPLNCQLGNTDTVLYQGTRQSGALGRHGKCQHYWKSCFVKDGII